jgi:hypothetical protein
MSSKQFSNEAAGEGGSMRADFYSEGHGLRRPGPRDCGDDARAQALGRVTITDVFEHPFEFLRTERRDRRQGFGREALEDWLMAAGLGEVRVDDLGKSGGTALMNIFAASGRK